MGSGSGLLGIIEQIKNGKREKIKVGEQRRIADFYSQYGQNPNTPAPQGLSRPEDVMKLQDFIRQQTDQRGQDAAFKELAPFLSPSLSSKTAGQMPSQQEFVADASAWAQDKGIDPRYSMPLIEKMQGLKQFETTKPGEGFTLSQGQQRFDQNGRPIATVAPKPEPVKYTNVKNAQGEWIQIPDTPGGGQNYNTGIFGGQDKGTEVSINLADNKGNSKLAEVMAQKQAESLSGYMTKAAAASEQRNGLSAQRTLIQQGLKTGTIQPMLQGISRFASDMGIDPTTLKLPDPAQGEAFNQASFSSLLTALQAQKGPQTEGDAQRALKTFAGMQNTEEGNMFIIDYLESVADRQEQMADFIFETATNKYQGDPRGVYRAEKDFREWARETPMVAKSPNSGLPVTYSQFKANAAGRDMTPEQIDTAWRSFAKGQ